MDFTNHPLNKQQYSKVIKLNNDTVPYSYDSDKIIALFKDLADVIPNDGYYPFYAKVLRQIGSNRFTELANKARASSDTPARLFAWMLKNPDLVR
jgi:hypothetical protein